MRLEFAQRHAHVNAKDIRMHSHRALELIYYLKGKGTSEVAGKSHPFCRGTFTITPAGMEHDQLDNGPVTSLCFGLLESGLESLAGAYQDRDGELLQVCERIMTELDSRQTGWQEMLQGLLYQTVALIRRNAAGREDEKPRAKKIVDRALAIIHSRAGMTTVSELSQQLFVSHDYLRHLFQEHAGLSPMRHIIRARIDKASGLLKDTELAIADVAARTGFDNPYYFSRLFKQVTGSTPSAYRKKHQH